MSFPHTIKISRHHHRISHTPSLPLGEWSCGVCHQRVESDYGAYSCKTCCDYAVHSRCALRLDVCDGKELQGVPEEDDITQDAGPFEIISDGVILHFLHDHHLQLKDSTLHDENKLRHSCCLCLPIYDGNIYSCIEFDFILHEICANMRRRIHHALYPHPLTLKVVISGFDGKGYFQCIACLRDCGGFVYESSEDSLFRLDVRCAAISEPFDYEGHEHPLYLALDPRDELVCQVCKFECGRQLNCIKCNFNMCFTCATLPYKARYKHDTHFLTVLFGEEKILPKDWCEICELSLEKTRTKVFYWCNYFCTTLHTECLLGEDPYLKPGKTIIVRQMEFHILCRNNVCRPFCHHCKNSCEDKIFKSKDHIVCSTRCADAICESSDEACGSSQ